MPYVKGLDILNDCEENQKLAQKLPDWTAAQWNPKVTQVMRDDQEFPTFQEFVFFIVTEAETLFHALHSSDTNTEKRNLKEKKYKSSVYYTQGQLKPSVKPPCLFCQDSGHQLHCCPKEYVKENRRYYGCLKSGHNAKDCRNRHTCDKCKARHPTLLHEDDYNKAKPTSVSNQGAEETPTTLSLSVTTKESSTNTSMIVPGWISSVGNPGTEKLVYVLLDTQSDTVFIDQEVSNSLQTEAHPVKLKLTPMMGKDALVHSQKVSGLRVRGYSSAVHVDPHPAYTKDCILVNRTHIPTRDTARHWNHLIKIADEMKMKKAGV